MKYGNDLKITNTNSQLSADIKCTEEWPRDI